MFAAGIAALAFLVLIGPGKKWYLWKSDIQSSRQGLTEEARQISTPTADAFERTMIRDIAIVPFKEMFDLLRSASREQRLSWIKQLDEMPTSPKRTVAISNFYKTFVQLDPRAAAESITTLTHEGTQALAAAAMVGAVPQSAMEEMATMLAKFPSGFFGRSSPDYLGNVIYDWAAIDPSSAARFLDEHPEVIYHAESLLLSWGSSDPDGAKAWLANQPESVQSDEAFASLLDGWLVRDQAAALAFEVEHAGEQNFTHAINNTTQALFLQSPDEARSFLQRLPNKARDTALHELGSSVTGGEYNPTIEWQRKPEDVARWMITLPVESWNKSLPNVLENWDHQDATGFSVWLQQLPQESRNSVVEIFGLQGSLEQAIPLLLTISDPSLQNQAIKRYIKESLPESRDKAIREIKQSNLSAEQQQYLVERLR